MVRPLRILTPGLCYHVGNRALARRPAFDSPEDRNRLLGVLAECVGRGQIEVLAYSLLTTHYHLLVRNLGETGLSDALELLQSEYTRRFNEPRDRDGPLWRGRYFSRPLGSVRYQLSTFSYVDFNPVVAGIVLRPQDYEFGSAYWYARGTGPGWLARGWIEEFARRRFQRNTYDPSLYARLLYGANGTAQSRFVERRMQCAESADDPLDELLGMRLDALAGWFARRARIADGRILRCAPVVDPVTVREIVAARVAAGRDTEQIRIGRVALAMTTLLEVALLHELAGGTFTEIARWTDRPRSSAFRTYEAHRRLVVSSAVYAQDVATVSRLALDACHGEAATESAANW